MFRAVRILPLALTVISFLGGANPIFGKLDQYFLEGDDFSLVYAKEDDTAVSVETSSNFADWSEAFSRETLLASEPGMELIKSSVSRGEQAAMFLRLRVASGWRVNVSWDASDDSSVAGYRIYYLAEGERQARQIDVGYRTDAVLFLPENGLGYTFVVTCYNSAGLESEPSAEAKVLPP